MASTLNFRPPSKPDVPRYANIVPIGEEPGPYGKKLRQFQFNYTIGGSCFARTMDEEKLRQFLMSEVGLPEDALHRIMRQVYEEGRTIVGEIDIPEHETGVLGLEQVPTDF